MFALPRWSEPESAYHGADSIEDVLRRSLRPDPVLTVSEWANRYRMLSTKLAAEAGPYRPSRAPFLRGVMDALSPTHSARHVVFINPPGSGRRKLARTGSGANTFN